VTGYCAIKACRVSTPQAAIWRCRTCSSWRLRTANELCPDREEAEKP